MITTISIINYSICSKIAKPEADSRYVHIVYRIFIPQSWMSLLQTLTSAVIPVLTHVTLSTVTVSTGMGTTRVAVTLGTKEIGGVVSVSWQIFICMRHPSI